MEDNPFVSVIIPTYNRHEFLEEAILSIVNQTYKNIEILIIDDGSKINYAEKICSKHSQCKYYFKTNGGLSSARNFGIKMAKGDFIGFLDDDDIYLPNKIELQVKLLIENKDIDCVHSSALVIDENGKQTGEIIGASNQKAHKRSGNVFWNALGLWVVKSPTPLFRKKVFEKIIFDESIKVGEDVDFYQRMFYFFKVHYSKEPLSLYRDYNDLNRLSKKAESYIGLEIKILNNFIKMGVKNPFVLYKISCKLAVAAIRNWNNFSNNDKIKSNKILIAIMPFYFLNLPLKKLKYLRESTHQ